MEESFVSIRCISVNIGKISVIGILKNFSLFRGCRCVGDHLLAGDGVLHRIVGGDFIGD